MEDEFLLMEEESALEDGKAKRSSPTKWVVSLALLFLIPALVIMVVLSNRLQISWLRIDIVVCILTALFCVLVAVSLTLSGCGEQFQRMDQSIQPATDTLNTVRNEQTQLSKAIQSSNQNLVARIARLEENQHSLQDSAAKVGSAVGEEYALLRQVAQSLKQEMAGGLSVTTGNHKELHNAIVRLQKANESVSDRITAISEGQEELQKTLQAEIGLLADRLAAIPAGQTEVRKTLQKENGVLAGKITAISESQQELQKTVQAENRLLADKIAAIPEGQEDLRETLQAECKLLADRLAAIPESQERLREALQADIEPLAGRIAAIPERQERLREALQADIGPLADRIAEIPAGQERLREALQANIGPLADRIAEIPAGQERLREALQAEIGPLADRIAEIPAGQERLREALQAEVGPLADRIAEIPESQERLREALQAEIGALTDRVAAIPESQERLREALQTDIGPLADRIAAIPASQEELRNALQEENRLLASRIAAIPEGQEEFLRALQEENQLLTAKIANLGNGQEQLLSTASTLQVLTETTTSNITNIADEQVALHRTLRENIDAQASSAQAAEQYQQAMEQQVSRVDAASQQMADVMTAVRAGQNTLLETIETKNEDLASQLAALSGTQQTMQTGVDSLDDKTNRAMAEVRAISDGQASANEMLHAHTEEASSQMASLAAKGEQINNGLDRLKELTEAIANNATGIASEQASLHRTARENSQMLVDKIEGTQQSIQDGLSGLEERATTITADIGAVAAAQSQLHRAVESGKNELGGNIGRVQQTLQEGINGLGEKATLMAEDIGTALTAQADLRQIVETNDAGAASKLTALLESQLTFHAGANLVSEKTEHAVTKMAEVAARQTTLSETLQAHVEAFNAEIPPLVVGNSQLKVDVDRLQELAQTVANTVTRISDEQTTLQGILQNNTQVLTDNIAFSEQNQKTLQREVNRVAEAGEQTTTAVTGMASEQTELRDLLKTNNEELINQCAVITESQRALITGINGLGEKTAEAAARVAGVTSGQSLLAEAVHTHAKEVTAQMTVLADGQEHVASNLGDLQKLAKTVSDNVTHMDEEQIVLQAAVRDGVHTLDSSMRNVTQRQQTLEEGVDQVVQGNQETATVVTSIAAKQAALQETLKTENREMNDQFSSISEEQHSLRVELSKVAESGQETAATTGSMATYQATLNEIINAKSEELNQRLSSLSENQQILRSGIGEIDDKVAQTATDIGSMARKQATLHELAKERAKEAGDHVDSLAQTQRNLREGIATLQMMGQQVAEKIAQIADAQGDQAESTQRENDQLLDQLNTLTGNQGQLHSNVNGLREIAQRTAVQVKDISEGQVAVHKTLQDSTKASAEINATVTQNQQALQTELHKLTEASRQAAAVVTSMATEQNALCDALRTESEELSGQVATFSEDQQVNIEKLNEATQQVAAVVTTIAAEQNALCSALRTGNKELSGQVATLSEDQQVNIEKLNEATRQVATDLVTVDHRQVKLGEAIQAYSKDLVARVSTIKQDQQQWLEQFDAAQAKIHPMWSRVDSMGQEVVQFQETLQRSIQELSDLLDARNQQRIEFEERVNQDLIAITESVSHIQQAWGAIQTGAFKRKDGTPAKSEDIAWAISQLKNPSPRREPNKTNTKSAPKGEAPQSVDASLNIELGSNDGQP